VEAGGSDGGGPPLTFTCLRQRRCSGLIPRPRRTRTGGTWFRKWVFARRSHACPCGTWPLRSWPSAAEGIHRWAVFDFQKTPTPVVHKKARPVREELKIVLASRFQRRVDEAAWRKAVPKPLLTPMFPGPPPSASLNGRPFRPSFTSGPFTSIYKSGRIKSRSCYVIAFYGS